MLCTSWRHVSTECRLNRRRIKKRLKRSNGMDKIDQTLGNQPRLQEQNNHMQTGDKVLQDGAQRMRDQPEEVEAGHWELAQNHTKAEGARSKGTTSLRRGGAGQAGHQYA